MASSANPRQLPSKTCGCPRCRETYPGERAKTKNCTARWQARYYDVTGKRRSAAFDTRRDAVTFLDSQRTAVRARTWNDPKRGTVSVAAFREIWLQGREVVRSTAAREEGIWRTHVAPRWGDVPISAIEHLDVQGWVKALGATIAPSTVARVFNALDVLCAAAFRDKRVPANACDGIVLPKARKKHPSESRPPSREQVALIREHMGLAVYRRMTEIEEDIGLRIGELIALRPWHLDLAYKGLESVRVVEVIEEVGSHRARRAFPKSEAGFRTIPLTPRAVSLFKEQMAQFPPAKTHSLPGADMHPEELIFRRKLGGEISVRDFHNDVWLPATIKSGVHRESEGLAGRKSHWPRFHDLRHLFASRLEHGGVPESTRKELLGHGRPSGDVTWVYTHGAEDVRDMVIAALTGEPKTNIRYLKAL